MLLSPTPPIRPSSGLDHGGELIVEPPVRLVARHPQVHRGQLPDAEAAQVVLDAAAQLIRVAVGQPSPALVAACADLADQREVVGVGMQRLADELVGDAGPVVLRGVNVIHAQLQCAAQHLQRLTAVPRRPPDTRAGQLHGAETDARDREITQSVTVHGTHPSGQRSFADLAEEGEEQWRTRRRQLAHRTLPS
jgi:hypothetical protein